MGDIARAAGVSLETVKQHGPKHRLLLRAFERTLSGREGDALLSDDHVLREKMESTASDQVLELAVGMLTEMNARVAALWPVFASAAASEPLVRDVLDDLHRRRHLDHVRLVELLDRHGLLVAPQPSGSRETGTRHDERDARATAIEYIDAPDGYLHFVIEAGWPESRYRAWLVRMIRAVLAAE